MSGWLVILGITVAIVGVIYGTFKILKWIWGEQPAPAGSNPQSNPLRGVGSIFTFFQSPKSVWTILGLWGFVMGALYAYYPGTFNEFFADHWVFLGLPVVLVILAVAIDTPTKSPATRWIGGALVVCLVALYVPKALEQIGVAIPDSLNFGQGSTPPNIHRVLEPGEQTTVEIPYGYAFDLSCDVPALIISPRRTPCVPTGGAQLGNAVSHITFQALDQELRVSVRLTPAP